MDVSLLMYNMSLPKLGFLSVFVVLFMHLSIIGIIAYQSKRNPFVKGDREILL